MILFLAQAMEARDSNPMLLVLETEKAPTDVASFIATLQLCEVELLISIGA